MNGERQHVIVIGGSVGGLATALELRRQAGLDVTVYERSPAVMQARGAGVVMQAEVAQLLGTLGVSVPDVSVQLQERVSWTRAGRSESYRSPQWMTAWDALYSVLLKALGTDGYQLGHVASSVEESAEGSTVRFADGSSASAQWVIGADGVNSACRQSLVIDSAPTYAGYLAWRGLEPEAAVSPSLLEQLRDRFSYFQTPGSQFLCYLVPGASGEREPGQRRVNWVWYVNASQTAAACAMRGVSGRTYRSFLPASEVSAQKAERLAQLASEQLPPLFCQLVEESHVFLQPVQDVAPVRRVHGHTLLCGDAAGTVRPHTAAGTSKAFGDAITLGSVLRQGLSLDTWEAHRQLDLGETAKRGLRLAHGSGLGTPAIPNHWSFES